VHQDQQRLRVLVLHHQGFVDGVFVRAKLPRGFGGAAVIHIIVKVFGKGDAVLAKKRSRRRFAP
jgi:hypothetical protein